jgi:hypothetical protein
MSGGCLVINGSYRTWPPAQAVLGAFERRFAGGSNGQQSIGGRSYGFLDRLDEKKKGAIWLSVS